MESANLLNRVSPAVILAYVTCACIWGTTWFAIRVCIGPGGLPVLASAAIRFSIAAGVLILLWLLRRRSIKTPTSEEIKWIAFAGGLSGIGYSLIYAAEESLSGGIAAVLLATGPLVSAIIGAVTKTEKLSRTAIIGSLVALVGVSLVFHDRLQVSLAQASAVGLLMIVCVLSTSANVAMKRYANGVSAIASNTVFFTASAVLQWLAAAISGKCSVDSWNFGPTLALLYLAFFGTLIAFGSFFYVLKHVRLSTAMTLSFITPVIAIIVDAFLEKHVLMNAETYLGVAVVLMGVAVSVLLKK